MPGSPDALAHWLAAVSPPGTAVAARAIAAEHRAFDPGEAAAVAGARPKRRDEFLTGRTVARAALAALGCPPRPLPPDADRVPVWPTGFVGSISHAGGIAVAQVALAAGIRSLGIDIEPAGAAGADLARTLCRPDEWRAIERRAPPAIDAPTLCFCAKEAVFKAWFPVARTWLEFDDLHLEVDWRRRTFAARLTSPDKPAPAGRRSFVGRFTRSDELIAAAVWVASGPRNRFPTIGRSNNANALSGQTTVYENASIDQATIGTCDIGVTVSA